MPSAFNLQSGDLRKALNLQIKIEKSLNFAQHLRPASSSEHFSAKRISRWSKCGNSFYRYFGEKNFDYEIELQQVGKL